MYFKFSPITPRLIGDRVAVEFGEELELARVVTVNDDCPEDMVTYVCELDEGAKVTVAGDRCWLLSSTNVPPPTSTSTSTAGNSTAGNSTAGNYFPTLYSLSTTPPSPGYALDYLCLLSNTSLLSLDLPPPAAVPIAPDLPIRDWSESPLDPHFGQILHRPAPSHLASISASTANISDATVVGYIEVSHLFVSHLFFPRRAGD